MVKVNVKRQVKQLKRQLSNIILKYEKEFDLDEIRSNISIYPQLGNPKYCSTIAEFKPIMEKIAQIDFKFDQVTNHIWGNRKNHLIALVDHEVRHSLVSNPLEMEFPIFPIIVPKNAALATDIKTYQTYISEMFLNIAKDILVFKYTPDKILATYLNTRIFAEICLGSAHYLRNRNILDQITSLFNGKEETFNTKLILFQIIGIASYFYVAYIRKLPTVSSLIKEIFDIWADADINVLPFIRSLSLAYKTIYENGIPKSFNSILKDFIETLKKLKQYEVDIELTMLM